MVNVSQTSGYVLFVVARGAFMLVRVATSRLPQTFCPRLQGATLALAILLFMAILMFVVCERVLLDD